MSVDVLRVFVEPTGFRPERFVDDLFERCEDASEIACILAVKCDLCCLLNVHSAGALRLPRKGFSLYISVFTKRRAKL